MKKLNYFFATFAIVATASCAKELNPSENVEIASGEENKVPMTINVSCAEPETETVLDGLNILWNKDKISVIDGSTYSYDTVKKKVNPGTSNNKFTTTAQNAAVAEFTGTAGPAETYYVISPYVESYQITTADDATVYVPTGLSAKQYAYQIKDSGKDRLYIFQPGLQKPVTGGYDPNAHYLIGKSDLKSDLELSNLNGLLKFSLTGSNVKEVTLYANNNEHIAGLAVVEFDEGTGKPKIVAYANEELQSSFIRVKPASGDTFAPGSYYISVPPTNFTKGIRVEVISEIEGQLKSYDRTGNNALEVKRAQVTNLGTLDANPDWLDVEIMDFMDFARQNDVASPFQIKIDKHWPFSNCASSGFQSSTTKKSGEEEKWFGGVRKEFTLSDGYNIYVYATNYICTTHSINGWRISGTAAGTYAELSGKSGQKIVKVQLISGNGITHSLTKTDGTTVLEGGAKSTAVYGASQVFCPKVDQGESIHIKTASGSLQLWSVRVYFGDKNIIAPTHAGTAVTRTATHQISDDGKKMTLKGAFTMPDANFDNEGVEYGFEYQQSGAEVWDSVTCTDIYYTNATFGSEKYYGFKCDLTGLGIQSGQAMKYRAWVKGNADAERKYGTDKYCYPSARVITIDFADNAQLEDCIISNIKTAGDPSVYQNKLVTGQFESEYNFEIWGGNGISKSTSGGGLKVGGLLFMPYKENVGGGACNSWIKLPIKTGKKIEQVAVSLTKKNGYQVNISSSVDPDTGEGNADIVANKASSSTSSSFTLKLPEDKISADTNYYLCIETTNPEVNSIIMSQIRIYYHQ